MSCPDCFRGSIHTHATPHGSMQTIHGVNCYVAAGSDPERSKSTILYLPDIFSLRLPNNMILADSYAAATGCRVIFPDVVYGGGVDPSNLARIETIMSPDFSVWQKIVATIRALPALMPVMLFGRPNIAYPKILKLARDLRADLPEGGKLGVCGFCWGGWPSTKLCAETIKEGDESSGRLIDAQFTGHPSFIIDTPEMIVDAITKYNVPYSVAVAEDDWQFNTAAAEKMEALVRQKSANADQYIFEFREYKNCKHGFCVRSQEDTVGFKGYEDAVVQATELFNKYLN